MAGVECQGVEEDLWVRIIQARVTLHSCMFWHLRDNMHDSPDPWQRVRMTVLTLAEGTYDSHDHFVEGPDSWLT